MTTNSRAVVLVPATVLNDDNQPHTEETTPVASAVLARWEDHQTYAQAVLARAWVQDTQEEADLQVAIATVATDARKLRAPSRRSMPVGWLPWTNSQRERFGMIAEAIQQEQERLRESKANWETQQRAFTRDFELRRLQVQEERLLRMVDRIREFILPLPSGPQLDHELSQMERQFHVATLLASSDREPTTEGSRAGEVRRSCWERLKTTIARLRRSLKPKAKEARYTYYVSSEAVRRHPPPPKEIRRFQPTCKAEEELLELD